jgi:hypothetical protein
MEMILAGIQCKTNKKIPVSKRNDWIYDRQCGSTACMGGSAACNQKYPRQLLLETGKLALVAILV